MKKIITILLLLGCHLSLHAQIITTIAGGATGHGGDWGDGGLATAAQLTGGGEVATDAYGNVYISCTQRIRKIDAATGIITTIAGTGVAGFSGDGLPATIAQFHGNGTISSDIFNNLFIADCYNHRTRKVNLPTDTITTIAGNGIFGSTGEGIPATAAEINNGGPCTMDNFGNLYLIDPHKIRKVDASGIITTVAGTGVSGITGEGVPAISTPIIPQGGIDTDSMGNIYFVDSIRTIRKITVSTGLITRVAGTGDFIYTPYSGDGIAATTCHIGPQNLDVDQAGNIYISQMRVIHEWREWMQLLVSFILLQVVVV